MREWCEKVSLNVINFIINLILHRLVDSMPALTLSLAGSLVTESYIPSVKPASNTYLYC